MAAGDYGYTGSITKVTVGSPGEVKAGTYNIVAYGAQGGNNSYFSGGLGAEVGGDVKLQAGENLEIVVGGQGGSVSGGRGAGGGGGSFVLADVNAKGTLTPGSYRLLLAAGGGGGAAYGTNGSAGQVSQGNGAGGSSGDYGGGGGSGYGGAGGNGYDGAKGGANRSGGYAGGVGGGIDGGGGKGGFGGGGGGANSMYAIRGGGAGGYTGGSGYGGGGQSIDRGTPVAAQTQAGVRKDDGLVELTALCFASGTLIRTACGEVAVDNLGVGDLAVTASGEHRPVKWLGHRTIDCHRHPSPREAMPIRVVAHAFGQNRPARDMLLSPGHSICVDVVGGVLIPVGRLVNGATIAQLDVDTVTYWHVELDSHDILLAENLPCESYIDCGTRAFFAESEVVSLAASPDAPALTTADYCRPFKPEGALVDMVRDRLSQRAADLGWRLSAEDEPAGLRLEADGARIDAAITEVPRRARGRR